MLVVPGHVYQARPVLDQPRRQLDVLVASDSLVEAADLVQAGPRDRQVAAVAVRDPQRPTGVQGLDMIGPGGREGARDRVRIDRHLRRQPADPDPLLRALVRGEVSGHEIRSGHDVVIHEQADPPVR